jgi:hypothetical protein
VNAPASRLKETTRAAAAYAALTLVMTWPIGRGLTHDVPADLGDSLLVMWVMAWVSEAVMAIARGDLGFGAFWNANIFHPAPLSLTFSEHFVPQAIQGLPAYLATGNIVLAYNLVFLATFALSGLGMFLLVRQLTGSARAAFVAGLFYAFFPYRLGQFPHLQTLSSQWMPFALYGYRCYFDTGRRRALAGGTAAFVVQGLSTGYYLFYFAPVLLGYVVWEMAFRGRMREWRTWLAISTAGAAATAVTLPFLLPYATARTVFGHSRPRGEVLSFSADLFTYLHASPLLQVWGSILHRFAQPEGGLFPGAVPIIAGIAALAVWVARAVEESPPAHPTAARDARRGRLVALLVGLTALLVGASAVIAVTGGQVWSLGGVALLRMTSARRPLEYAVLCFAAALWISPRLRAAVRRRDTDLTPWLVLALAFSVTMSLGPEPHAAGRPIIGIGLYDFFYEFVPGYDGLRVPARFGMIAGCLLAVLGGYALARVARWPRFGSPVLGLVAVAFLAEACAVPQPVNLTWTSSAHYAAPWPSVHRLNEGPLAYRHALLMPADTVLLEMPFGDQAWDLRYVYYAGLHGKRIVNGYSGYYPEGYRARAARLAGLWRDGGAAWEAATSAGATHLLVHERGYFPPEGAAVSGWAASRGARLVVEFSDGDKLFELPRDHVPR